MQNIEQQLRNFIVDNFLYGEGGDGPANDDSFMDRGIVDSTGVLELVAFLEETFGITIEDHELIPANLDSIDRLVTFLERKLSRVEKGVTTSAG